jgi:hypothetical protein
MIICIIVIIVFSNNFKKDTVSKTHIQDNISNIITLHVKNSNEIYIYNDLYDGNTLLTKFCKKEWGTRNIGGWYLVEDNVAASPVY